VYEIVPFNSTFFTMEIISMTAEHRPQVKAVYESCIAAGNATFQAAAPGWEEWDKAHVKSCRLAGRREKTEQMNGARRDTLLLERRSRVTGV
jgi:L-amino acid N-acyltransferase YncA